MAKITREAENFVGYLMQGYNQTQAYKKAYAKKRDASYMALAVNASKLIRQPEVKEYYDKVKSEIQESIIQEAIWTKEQAIQELKDVLYKNKRESDRYDQAYDDEIEILDRQINEREDQLKNPKGYLSKKKAEQLQDEIDQLKLAKISANRRHQSNKSVNEAILQAVLQLNTMCGYNEEKKEPEPLQVQAQVIFQEDIPEED